MDGIIAEKDPSDIIVSVIRVPVSIDKVGKYIPYRKGRF
jgi:hypothetical protein